MNFMKYDWDEAPSQIEYRHCALLLFHLPNAPPTDSAVVYSL